MTQNYDIQGSTQIVPSATQAVQNNYYQQPAPLTETHAAHTVVVLGAGVDEALGLPASNSLIPRIVDWLGTDEGKAVDEALRKQLKRLTFRFDKFVSDAIDRLAKDLDREREAICRNISKELRQNEQLDETQKKMGTLIVRLFERITHLKQGATIDEETETLIQEVLGIEASDQSIIDFSKIPYTDTFRSIIVEILQKSMREVNNPVLRHVYRNLLDIEQLLAQYFYGFFTDKQGYIKTYLYISWVLWAFIVHEEQEAITHFAETDQPLPIYSQLGGKEIQLITFNYTSFAAAASSSALYFHGNLTDYVDIENKNDLHIDDIRTLDLADFFENRLPMELSLDSRRKAYPIPSFIPPLKLKPILSDRYISIWYRSWEAIAQAKRVLILGYSVHDNERFFNDMLRNNRQAEIIFIDRDWETVCRNLCATLQLSPDRYTQFAVSGHPARKYDNRITVIQADLAEIDLGVWLEDEKM